MLAVKFVASSFQGTKPRKQSFSGNQKERKHARDVCLVIEML